MPTVVLADWQALSCPPAGALPRNRLASSATGGASAISPPFCAPGRRASDCIKCGKCEKACPQHLPIRQLLEQVSQEFDKAR
ncbi:4Fe-4S dicluster domain-containing protein [Clostridiaceae bacterium Marseille-Q4149]|nr:4Fe-4S dicluster domain-containing protein [Clostridiaceae bacterium Marseille-Q4149]